MNCRNGQNPLHWGSFCADQDASSAAAIQSAVESSGETRASNWQFCQIHTQKASSRKFARDTLSKSSMPGIAVPGVDGVACPNCRRVFRSRAGLASHRRSCKAAVPESAADNAPTGNPLDPLLRSNNFSAKEAKAYKEKLKGWLLMRKNRELRNGTNSFRAFKCTYGTNDIYLKIRLRQAASSIIRCIQNEHDLCARYSFVCKDGVDPYLYLLPHSCPISPMPSAVQSMIQESVNDLFSMTKLDRLIYRGKLQTTSHVEAVHRTIRQAAPKVRNGKGGSLIEGWGSTLLSK